MTQPVLDLVIAALEKIREKSDRAPRASRSALARLEDAPVAASLREACTSIVGGGAAGVGGAAGAMSVLDECGGAGGGDLGILPSVLFRVLCGGTLRRSGV